MKIIKYLFLLLILAAFASVVYIATEKSAYTITKSKTINSQKTTIFDYVNEYKNYENWNYFLTEKSPNTILFSKKTSGVDSFIKWNSENGEGSLKTIFVKDKDSIVQELNFEGSKSIISWGFKSINGKTEVRCKIVGQLPFFEKIIAITKGGVATIVKEQHDKNLAQLDRSLDYEINTYSILVDGVFTKNGGYYMQQTINSKDSNIYKNIKIMLPNLVSFFSKNKVAINGNPFVIYNTIDEERVTTNFSLCIPIKEEIYTSSESDIIGGKLDSFLALKTTITGDYSHWNEGIKKAKQYLSKNNLTENKSKPTLYVFVKRFEQEKRPSKWITTIYIPIYPKSRNNQLTAVSSDTISKKIIIPN